MACNFNWFIKIIQSFGSGFQIKNCKARSKIDHDWTNLNRLSYQILLENTFGCELPTFHCLLLFFFLLLVLCLIMSVALDLPRTRILFQQFPIPIPYAEATSIAACCHFGAMLTPGFFHLSASSGFNFCVDWAENNIVTLRLVSCHRCAVPCFDLLFRVLKGISQVSCVVVSNRWWL